MANTVQLSESVRIQDAANYLGVSSKTLRRWEKSKKLIPERSFGNQRYYRKESLENFAKLKGLFPITINSTKVNGSYSNSNYSNSSYSNKSNFANAQKWILASSLWVFIFSFSNYLVIEGQTLKDKSAEGSNLTKVGSQPSVLAATTDASEISNKYTFTVNVPSKFNETVTFLKDIVAPNVVNSINDETGDITIDNSLTAGTGISILDRTITNSGIVTLSAGTGISVDGNKITNTYSFTPDYTQGGWTKTGTTVGLTTLTDSVTVGALTAGAVTVDSLTTGGLSLTSDLTVSSGHSLLPDTDLGSDIGSSSYRFNNLWVANINSNSSQSFSGQTTFSYPPTDTTINQASVLINPTTAATNGQLLGLGIAGYERAVIDEDGDMILGY
ncbi:MAG: MerR family transcriptional regulator, partial [Microgenomates group bacterium]